MGGTTCYHIAGTSVGLRFPSRAVEDVFSHVLGGFTSLTDSPSQVLYEIHAGKAPSAFTVSSGGRAVGAHASLFQLVTVLEREILGAAFREMPGPGIHAGSLVKDGAAVLFPGDPGAGKTSIVLGLLLRGWTLLSDEAAPLPATGTRVAPFPRALWIKPGGADIFVGVDTDGLLNRAEAALKIGPCVCVTPRVFPRPQPERTYPVKAVVFPSVSAGETATLVPVTRAHAAARMLDLTFNRDRCADGGLGQLAGLAAGADCYDLVSGSLRQSVDVLTGVLG